MNARMTQSIIVSRSRTRDPPHSDFLTDHVSRCNSILLGGMIDSKLTFEKHYRFVFLSIAQKIGILRKFYEIFGEQVILKKLS